MIIRILVAILWLSGCAAAARSRLADGALARDGDVTEAGIGAMTVIVKRLPHQPVTSCQLYLRGGVHNWTAETAGVERLALATAINGGTETLTKAAFLNRLAGLGTQLGAESGNDSSLLGFKALDRNFAASFELLADALLHPALPDGEIVLQRELMQAELRQEEENPDAALLKLSHAQLYAGLPYANRSTGTPESIARLTREDLLAALARLRETGRMVLVVVGNVEAEAVLAQARKAFGDLPAGGYQSTPLPRPAPLAAKVQLVDRPLPTNYLVSTFPAPTWGDPQLAVAEVALDALRDAFFEEIRTKRQLSYAPAAGLAAQGVGEGYFYATAVEVEKTEQILQQVVRQYQTGKLDPLKLEGTKRVFLTNFLLQNEPTSGQAELLARAELVGGDWRLARDLPERVKQVTAEEVGAYLSGVKHLQTVVLGNTAKLSPQAFEGL